MSEETKDSIPSSTPVLVVGATGYLGRHIVAQLRQMGYPVRALVRDPSRLGAQEKSGVELFVGQVTQPETLEGLCDGISVVVSVLGVRSLARKPTPWEVDYQGNLNVLACAQKAGVKHFIFVGVLRGAEFRTRIPVLEPRERFIDTLCQSGLAWTVLRPTGAFNDMEAIFRMARRGRVFLIGSGEAHINPIHATDIGIEVAHCIEETDARNKVYDIGGPKIFTYTEIAQIAFQAAGTKSRITHIFPWLMDGLVRIFSVFNPTGAGFLRFFRWVTTTDMVGTLTGQICLEDFFLQLANQSQPVHREEE
jgi:uncharacterized protein YbjT (DUF2867 family)